MSIRHTVPNMSQKVLGAQNTQGMTETKHPTSNTSTSIVTLVLRAMRILEVIEVLEIVPNNTIYIHMYKKG